MYQNATILAAFLLVYSAIAGRIEGRAAGQRHDNARGRLDRTARVIAHGVTANPAVNWIAGRAETHDTARLTR